MLEVPTVVLQLGLMYPFFDFFVSKASEAVKYCKGCVVYSSELNCAIPLEMVC